MRLRKQFENLQTDVNSLYLKYDAIKENIDSIMVNQQRLMNNQKTLLEAVKKLADAMQLEYLDGKYVSKRGKKALSKVR